MALRRFMHPRNKYKEGADFKQLAILYPEFCRHMVTDLSGKLRYNFRNDESLRVLTKTLLKHDFDVDVEIPTDKLVPAMPLRLNYVLWIEDLMMHAKLSQFGEIHGIDIGTGAVCIYPLLCAKLYGWKMTGTEISESSIASAKRNIEKNRLAHLIKVIHIKEQDRILTEVSKESEYYSFTMCNPPFFNMDEIAKTSKRLPPRNATTGSDAELRVVGGEKLFVKRLIDESIALKDRVKIYTTMLGHKSSCRFFRSELKRRDIENATWTEFCQGHTKRWGLAWTFLSKEIIDLTTAPRIRTRENSRLLKASKERPSETIFPLQDEFNNLYDLIASVRTWLQELKIEIKDLPIPNEEYDGWGCQLKAHEDSWSHARRKRRMAQRSELPTKNARFENPETEKSNDTVVQSNETLAATTISTNPLLECSLMIGQLENENNDEEDDFVKICMIYEDGPGGKIAMESLRQYLINKLNIRDYLLSRSRSKSTGKKKRRKGKSVDRGVVESQINKC